MTRAPAFQFYPADYLADAKVQAMSIEGEGCYIRLMAYCWREGSLPNDRAALARLCKGYKGPGLDEAILCFIKIKKNTKLSHKRLISEKRIQKNRRKLLSEAGLRGVEKRWPGHSQAKARLKPGDSSSSSSSSSNKNIPLPPSTYKRREEYKPHDIAIEDYWRRKGARGGGGKPPTSDVGEEK